MRWTDLGERFLLRRIGYSAGADSGIDIDIVLFTNSYTFDNDDFVLGDFDEVDSGVALWYSRLEIFNWNTPGTTAGLTSMLASSVLTWTSDGTGSTTVYGYLFVEHDTDDVLSGENFPGPVTMSALGSLINIQGAISLSDSED